MVFRTPEPDAPLAPTRLIAIGSAALVEGFALIGFETYPDVGLDRLEQILLQIERLQDQALIFLESDLARCDCAVLDRIRTQYVRVVVVEIPELHAPDSYQPEVEELVRNVLGPAALDTPS
jgi:vacuolar-type H+-ATPase subunit F/Vma7